MFDAIDTRHDQVLDQDEWKQAFGGLVRAGPKVSVKATPLTQWENSMEAEDIGVCLARNRRLLLASFRQHSTHSDHQGDSRYVTFPQAKAALDGVLQDCFARQGRPISDDKLACILRVGQVV